MPSCQYWEASSSEAWSFATKNVPSSWCLGSGSGMPNFDMIGKERCDIRTLQHLQTSRPGFWILFMVFPFLPGFSMSSKVHFSIASRGVSGPRKRIQRDRVRKFGIWATRSVVLETARSWWSWIFVRIWMGSDPWKVGYQWISHDITTK